METAPHPTRIRLARTRGMLLTLLRGFEADGKGFAGAQAALLEALADDYLFGVGHGDADVKEAWSEFYGRVSEARVGSGRRNKVMPPDENTSSPR